MGGLFISGVAGMELKKFVILRFAKDDNYVR